MLTDFLSRLTSMFAQQTAQAAMVGVLAGAVVATGLVATGVIPVGGSAAASPTVALLACPGIGPVLARINPGQTTLVTARSGDGQWLEVYIGVPGVERAWAPAAALRLESAADGLPVRDCTVPAPATAQPSPAPTPGISAAPSPSVVATVIPSPSAAPSASPSPKPTRTPKPTTSPVPSPSPNPSPTPFVDLTPPVLSSLTITSPTGFQGTYRIFRPSNCIPSSAKIQVTATDLDSAVSNVTIWFQATGETIGSDLMVRVGNSTTWEYTIATLSVWDETDVIAFWVRATDSSGNLSTTLYNNPITQRIEIDFCLT